MDAGFWPKNVNENSAAAKLRKQKELFTCSSSSSSSVDQLDAGRRPLCPIHYVIFLINSNQI